MIAAARLRRRTIAGGWTAVVYGLLVLLVLGPLAGLVYQSFRTSRGRADGLTLHNYKVLGSPSVRDATTNTLLAGLGATIGAIAIGGGLAWLAARTDVPGRRLVQMAGMIPLFFSAIVGALAWSALASPRTGYLNALFDAVGIPITLNIYTMHGIIFVLAIYYAPFAFVLIFSGLSMASADLEGAARVHGASGWRVASHVTFPLVLPSIAAAAILIFILTAENFPVVEILGSYARINFLPALLFRLVNQSPSREGEAAAIGMAVLVVMFLLVWLQSRFVHRRSYVTISGKGGTASRVSLGRWRWVGFGFAVSYILVAAVLPIIALVLGAFRRNAFYRDLADLTSPTGFTTEHFVDALSFGPFRSGLRNSVMLSLCAALLGVAVNFLLAYAARRRTVRGARMIEYFVLAPVAIPAMLLGLSFVSFWLRLPVSLYGTLTILVMAYVARFVPQGFENFASTLVKVDEQLEESAITSGASRLRAVIAITLPLLRSTAVATGVLLFILSFREVTVALFLYTPQTRPLSVVIYNQWSSGSWPNVASMSLVFTGVLFVAALFSRRGTDARS